MGYYVRLLSTCSYLGESVAWTIDIFVPITSAQIKTVDGFATSNLSCFPLITTQLPSMLLDYMS